MRQKLIRTEELWQQAKHSKSYSGRHYGQYSKRSKRKPRIDLAFQQRGHSFLHPPQAPAKRGAMKIETSNQELKSETHVCHPILKLQDGWAVFERHEHYTVTTASPTRRTKVAVHSVRKHSFLSVMQKIYVLSGFCSHWFRCDSSLGLSPVALKVL